MNWRIPLADIDFGPEEEEAIRGVVRSRWLSMGEVTQKFEAEFGEFLGTPYAIAVTNATAALHLACVAIALKPGDEVILPSLTFVATANAVRYTGATAVFADIENPQQLTLSPDAVAACITPKTRAIIVMHYAGYACDMPALLEIAHRHNLAVIEDSAHAIGSELGGRKLGTWGKVGCFSFFSNKNMTTAEGGMLATFDPDLAQRLRLLRSHGMTSLSWDRHTGHASTYDVVEVGYNYRIDELRAALGRTQLGKLHRNNERRGELTGLYRELLTEVTPEIEMPFGAARGSSCYHILPVLLPLGSDRDLFMQRMRDRGVQTSIHYPPVHKFSAYRDREGQGHAKLPVTEDVAGREVTLPLYPAMSESDVAWVVDSVRSALDGWDSAPANGGGYGH
jgi:dTDP-4-amino-4,6-dideoxygalactose transaminase